MSEEEKNNEAGLRAVKVLAPSGKLSKYIGIVNAKEHIILTKASVSHYILSNAQKEIDEGHPENIDQVFIDALAHFTEDYNSRTGSRDGVRSKQLSKISGAVKTGMPIEDDKRSRLDRILGRNKGVLG